MVHVLRWMIFSIGVLCFAGFVMTTINERNFLRVAAKATGVVEEIKVNRYQRFGCNGSQRECERKSMSAIVKYEVDGVVYRVSFSAQNRVIGQGVSLLYDRRSPMFARDDSFSGVWGMASGMLAVSTVAIGIFIISVLRRRKGSEVVDLSDQLAGTIRGSGSGNSLYNDADEVSMRDERSAQSSILDDEENDLDTDSDDTAYAVRYGTRTVVDAREEMVAGTYRSQSTPVPSRPSARSITTKAHRPIESPLAPYIQPIGFLLGGAAFGVTLYYGATLFLADDAKETQASLIIKAIIFLLVFAAAGGVAGFVYRLLQIVALIFQRD